MKSAEVFLLAALLLTGCTPPTADTQPAQQAAATPTPQAQAEANTQAEASAPALGGSWTLRAGDLQIDMDAPARVEAGEVYPVQATYTNAGTEPLELQSPECPIIYDVRKVPSNQPIRPAENAMLHCTEPIVEPHQLVAGEQTTQTFNALTSELPQGEYKLGAELWDMVARPYRYAGSEWEQHPLTPTPPEVRFEIAEAVVELGGSWTLRAGDLQIDVDAPAQVEAGELASIPVTYTNTGTEPLEMLDPFHCRVLHGVMDAATGQKPEPTQIYACTSDFPATIRLNPNEELANHVSPVIAGFPAGEYLLPAGWLGEMRQYGAAGDDWQEYTAYPLTPMPPEVRFEIR